MAEITTYPNDTDLAGNERLLGTNIDPNDGSSVTANFLLSTIAEYVRSTVPDVDATQKGLMTVDLFTKLNNIALNGAIDLNNIRNIAGKTVQSGDVADGQILQYDLTSDEWQFASSMGDVTLDDSSYNYLSLSPNSQEIVIGQIDLSTDAAGVIPLASVPSSYFAGDADPTTELYEGRPFYRTDLNMPRRYNGTAWENLPDAGMAIQNEGVQLGGAGTTLNFEGTAVTASGTGSVKTITITEASVVEDYLTADNTPDAIGTSGQVLAVNTGGTALEFGDAVEGYLTPANTPDTIGTAGQGLFVNSGGTQLEFSDVNASSVDDLNQTQNLRLWTGTLAQYEAIVAEHTADSTSHPNYANTLYITNDN